MRRSVCGAVLSGTRAGASGLIVALCLLSGVAAIHGRDYFANTQHFWRSFVETSVCLPPEEVPPPLRGCLVKHSSAPPPWAPARFALALIFFLFPWEVARYWALREKRIRLYYSFSLIVLGMWFPWSGVWWYSVWWGRWPGVLGLCPGCLRFLDLQWWNFQFSQPWLQFLPFAVVIDMLVRRDWGSNKAQPADMRFRGLALARLAVWGALAALLAYELLLLAIDGFGPWDQFLGLGFLGFIVVFFHRSWLYATAGDVQGGASAREEWRLSKVLRAGAVIFGGILIVTAIASLIFPNHGFFPLDVAINPIGQKSEVCPFLSTWNLAAAIFVILLGIFLGELLKVAAPARLGARLWTAGIVFQLLVACPLGAAVGWQWLQAGGWNRWNAGLWEAEVREAVNREGSPASGVLLQGETARENEKWKHEERVEREVAARAAALAESLRNQRQGILPWACVVVACIAIFWLWRLR